MAAAIVSSALREAAHDAAVAVGAQAPINSQADTRKQLMLCDPRTMMTAGVMRAVWPKRGKRDPADEKERQDLPERGPVQPAADFARPQRRTMPAELNALLAGGASQPATITIAVNFVLYTLVAPDPDLTLAVYLREQLQLTGTKISCGEGGCGACMVYVARKLADGKVEASHVNSCLRRVAQMDGEAVLTIEALGTADAPHPIQASIVTHSATQCGMCTPGWVMSMFGLVNSGEKPTLEQIEKHFDSNLCRCTGYRPLFAALRAVVPDAERDPNVGATKQLLEDGGAELLKQCGADDKAIDALANYKPCGKGDGKGCSSDAKHSCHEKQIKCGLSGAHACSSDIEELVFDPKNPKHKLDAFALRAPAGTAARSCVPKEGAKPKAGTWWTSNARTLFISVSKVEEVSAVIAFFADRAIGGHLPPHGSINGCPAAPAREIVRLQVASTSDGVAKYYPPAEGAADAPSVVVDLSRLAELRVIEKMNDAVTFHAAVSLARMQQEFSTGPPALQQLATHLSQIASTSLRSVASWAGNLGLARAHPDFPSDVLTILSAIGAVLTIEGKAGQRQIPVKEWLQDAIKKEHGEFIRSVRVPMLDPKQSLFRSFKVRPRVQLAHAVVNAALVARAGSGAEMVFGGIQRGLFIPKKATVALTEALKSAKGSGPGQVISREQRQVILRLLREELQAAFEAQRSAQQDSPRPMASVPEGKTVTQSISSAPFERLQADVIYRRNLAVNCAYKFLLQLEQEGFSSTPGPDAAVYNEWVRPLSSGVQSYTAATDAALAPVGLPIAKLEADIQSTGEARYSDDMPMPLSAIEDSEGSSNAKGGVFAATVWSTMAAASVLKLDATDALRVPGVLRFISAQDISDLGGMNDCGSFPGDEEVFASREVYCYGQALGLVVATTRKAAEEAATLVLVTYGPPTRQLDGKAASGVKPLLSLSDAIAARSFLPDEAGKKNGHDKMEDIVSGDVDAIFKKARTVSGTVECKAQYHFALEPQTAYCAPSPDGSSDLALDIWASTQGLHTVRENVARVLNVPAHRIVVHQKRAGGGFGSKLHRDVPNACQAAVACAVLRRPVKLQQSRYSETQTVGRRPHFLCEYTVAFDDEGRVLALRERFYFQGGRSYDLNLGTLQMALAWSDNVYSIKNFHVGGEVCRTHTLTNTSMRGPGNVRSIHSIEVILERVAVEVGLDPADVRAKNFYSHVAAITPYKLPMVGVHIGEVWRALREKARYDQARKEVQAFNNSNKAHKRGLAMTAVKYNMTYQGSENHHGCLLGVAKEDGSLLVTVTGAEMGQGLNTKVAATVIHRINSWLTERKAPFAVGMQHVAVGETSTALLANGGLTGGSSGSEVCALSALKATEELVKRLEPVWKNHHKEVKSWADLIEKAHGDHVQLQVLTEHNTPDPKIQFQYQVWAAACSMVEIDCLTGQHQVLETNIVYDVGASLNPLIDLGQMEGGFIMGLGHMTTEESAQSDFNGAIISKGSWDYHIPSSLDIPLKFNITLLPHVRNPNGIMDSKAVAEPPVMLSSSVFLALREAVAAARKDRGHSEWIDIPAPLSAERIQTLCMTDMSEFDTESKRGADGAAASK